ncbi:MAG: DUF3127 domain-containing protein [Raineya sp.]
MSFETKGKIVKILEPQTGSSKNGEWKKQDIVVETTEAYPKKICFSIWNDKISQLEGVEVGDEVRVMFNVASREYNNKWYSDITAYQIDNISKKEYDNVAVTPIAKQETNNLDLDILAASNDNEDLPF